jgi:roadblock/LC7 domain-containing protein
VIARRPLLRAGAAAAAADELTSTFFATTFTEYYSLRFTPAYPYARAAGSGTSYTMTFDPAWGDGVCIIGVPGGSSTFTSLAELAVY